MNWSRKALLAIFEEGRNNRQISESDYKESEDGLDAE